MNKQYDSKDFTVLAGAQTLLMIALDNMLGMEKETGWDIDDMYDQAVNDQERQISTFQAVMPVVTACGQYKPGQLERARASAKMFEAIRDLVRANKEFIAACRPMDGMPDFAELFPAVVRDLTGIREG